MLIFDRSFNKLRTKYIVPLSQYSVQYRHLNSCNIKAMIYKKLISAEQAQNGDFILTFDNEYLMKGLLGDIELFFIRTIQQREDAKLVGGLNNKITSNWNIVSNYYYGFFLASLLLRICFRGNIFFDKSVKRSLENIISTIIGERISVDSNCIYYIEKSDSDYILRLTKAADNTHELVWKEMDKLLGEKIQFSEPTSDEYTILKSMKSINNTLSSTYPSQLRNRVNYQPLYGIKYINGELYHQDLFSYGSWIKEILMFEGGKEYDDNKISNMFVAYVNYLERLVFKLLDEYYSIRGNQNGILKEINKKRTEKIILPEYPYVYDI